MTISNSEPFEIDNGLPDNLQHALWLSICLVFADHFTKFMVVVNTKDQTAVTTAKLF